MTPTLLSHLKPLSAITRAIPTIDSAVRLSLNPVQDRRAAVDGAWWPHSREAAAERPASSPPSISDSAAPRCESVCTGMRGTAFRAVSRPAGARSGSAGSSAPTHASSP